MHALQVKSVYILWMSGIQILGRLHVSYSHIKSIQHLSEMDWFYMFCVDSQRKEAKEFTKGYS